MKASKQTNNKGIRAIISKKQTLSRSQVKFKAFYSIIINKALLRIVVSDIIINYKKAKK